MSDEIIDYGDLAEEENEIRKKLADWLPRTGDRLFAESADGARPDPLGLTGPGEPRHPGGRWQLYADGFLLAADRLVDSYRGVPPEDALIYPILSLYRHHIELQIKWVIRWSPGCTAQIREQLVSTHGLAALWDKLAKVYPRFCVWTSAECTEACHRLILEFDEHDPKSQAGRYPESRGGDQTLTCLDVVDLPTLKLGVHKISHFLGTVFEQIGEDREWEAEMATW